MIKIFMLDDTTFKQKWFFKILDYLNSIENGICFEAGYGTDETVFTEKVCPKIIYDSLCVENSIYFVDLNLEETDEEAADLIEMIDVSQYDWANRTIEEYKSIIDEQCPLYELKLNYPIATIVLIAAKHKGCPSLLVSTEASKKRIGCIGGSDLDVVVPSDVFPDDDPDTSRNKQDRLKKWASYILALIDDPITHLRKTTKNWFEGQASAGSEWDYSNSGLPHDLNNSAAKNLRGHEDCVRKAFHWLPPNLPWWKDLESARKLHECLKHTVGSCTMWMGSTPRYSLCLGGAYFLLLIAISNDFIHEVVEFSTIDWGDFIDKNGIPIDFLPVQTSVYAERSVRFLFEFLSSIVTLKNSYELGLDDIIFPEPGEGKYFFKLHLKWTADQLREFSKKLAVDIDAILLPVADNSSPILSKSQTVPQFLRFLLSSQVANCGFGSAGTITLDRFGYLRIGLK